MIEAVLKYEFLQNALIISLLAALMCAITGVIQVERRSVMLSGGIAHTAYGGVGLGYLLGFEPIIGAALFSVCASLLIDAVSERGKKGTDVATALLWSLGMSFGVAFIALMDGYPPDVNSYLFGNILSVTKTDILLALPLAVIMLLVTVVFYRDWQAFLFDPEFSRILGIKTRFLKTVLSITTALTIVVLIKATGIILVIALLADPASCAAFFTKTLKKRMVLSFFFGVFFSFSGIILSYYFALPSGAAIVFCAVISYFVLLFTKGRK